MVLYNIFKLLDLILKNKLLTIDDKDTGSLVYLVNNIFLIHDILIGSQIARRMVQRSRSLLTYILKRSKHLILKIDRGYKRRLGRGDQGAP